VTEGGHPQLLAGTQQTTLSQCRLVWPQPQCCLRVRARREPREVDGDELARLQRAVPVRRGRHGLGQHHAGRIRGLPDARQVHAPRDLLRARARPAAVGASS